MSNSSKSTSRPSWVLYRCCAYLRGKGIHYGSAPGRIFPKRAYDKDKYCIAVDPRKGGDSDVCSVGLEFAKDSTFDWVFLDTLFDEHSDRLAFLKQVQKKLKPNGYVILLSAKGLGLPDKSSGWETRPQVLGRDGLNLLIYKRNAGYPGIKPYIEAANQHNACIVRYGAFGDQVIITPLIRALKDDGYHVTLNISSNSADVLKYNPYIDNLVLQEKDVIFNPELGAYWNEWGPEYDKYINLCESVEGTLLKVEGRADFYTTSDYRRKAGAVNYIKHTLALGGYPDADPSLDMFFSRKEEKKFLKDWNIINNKFRIVWVLKGSSFHKAYPLAQAVLQQWLKDKPDVLVFQVGGDDAKPYEISHPQAVTTIGQWDIRKSMLSTKFADCVVGPETGVMNAAGAFKTPKILMLSHSTPFNICDTWDNTIALTPNTEVAVCYPCHQMHYSMESCPLAQLVDDKSDKVCATGPVCSMGAISADDMVNALDTVYKKWKGPMV